MATVQLAVAGRHFHAVKEYDKIQNTWNTIQVAKKRAMYYAKLIMISIIKGKIIASELGEVTVLTPGGVGYRVFVNEASVSIWRVGSEAEILTYLAVRENALDLYGFASAGERYLFLKFLDVSGIGPKTALHILALGSVGDISAAINRGDVDYLTKVSGIGKKTAERMVVELKGKMAFSGSPTSQGGAAPSSDGVWGVGALYAEVADVIDGLIALGYSASDAREAVKKLDAKGKTSEQLLKEALRGVK